MADQEDEVYCLCRRTYDPTEFMIECDICNDWFHGRYGRLRPRKLLCLLPVVLNNAHLGCWLWWRSAARCALATVLPLPLPTHLSSKRGIKYLKAYLCIFADQLASSIFPFPPRAFYTTVEVYVWV